MVEIEIPYGKIRELEERDLPALTEICENPEIREFFFANLLPSSIKDYWHERLKDRQEARSAVAAGWIRQHYNLPIEERGRVVGEVSIGVHPYVFNFDKYPHMGNLSYFVGKQFRRRGIAEASVKASIPFMINELGTWQIQAICLFENIASQNLLGKAGLSQRWEGVCESGDYIGRNIKVYSTTRDRFFGVKTPTLEGEQIRVR